MTIRRKLLPDRSFDELRVVLLTNFIPPYHLPTLRLLTETLGKFQVFVSTTMEKNRDWSLNWRGIDVKKQRSITLVQKWKHPQGFTDKIFIHLPFATLFELREVKPDVIISTEMGLRSLLAIAYRFIFRSVRIILWLPLSEHTEQGRGWLRKIVRNLFVNRADAILVNGESGARYVKRFGVPDGRLFRVPYPTDAERLKMEDVSRDPDTAHRLLYVGQLIERKGILQFIEILIEWAKKHPHQKIHFQIVGSGTLYASIANIKRPDNLDVILLGHQDYDRLQEIYRTAGIFVFPTLADEWGIVVNEALYAGLPVLGSIYSQAVEELVEDRRNGWRFTPDDHKDTYRAIDEALRAPTALLSRMRTEGRTRALECTPDVIVRRVLDAINLVTRS